MTEQIHDEPLTLSYQESMPVKPFRYAALQLKRDIQRAQQGQYFLQSGLSTIDKWVRFRPTTYTVIGAESGVGKTALALQIAAHFEVMKAQWGDKRKTLIFSAEMAGSELLKRLVAARTGISPWDQESGNLTDDQVDAIYTAADAITADMPFVVDESDSPDRNHIIRSCNIVAESYGLAAVVFDYIELATTDEKFKAEHVRSVAKTLKNVARQFEVPTIGLSQVNKDNKHRGTKKPEMTDLRYGGHEPADCVIILQDVQEEMMATDDGYQPIRGWIVKNRSGRKGVSADLVLHGPTTTFKPGDFSHVELNT